MPHPNYRKLRAGPPVPQVLPHQRRLPQPRLVVKRANYEQTGGHAPPYLIFVDHDNREILLAIRGLNLVKESDYKVLLDNRLGMQKFDGGYVHKGLLNYRSFLLWPLLYVLVCIPGSHSCLQY
ncbi:alpha/beta-Hydrolases superfamily protein [Perilla frutescens var. hirtella]|nr:alpha/beta-Hydrolases superfamily protein [Perilla frutescens var. hirtella]